jgi:ABC-2 type transport system ATP-binding protein
VNSPDPPVVHARGLTKSYGNVDAVAGVDLRIEPGEVVSLLGPNGAGKTTLVELMEGYRRRDRGELTVLGQDPQRAPRSWRYGIGIVLQEARDAAELTVAETVRHFARYYPNPRDPDEIVEVVGLTEVAAKRVRTLSGGQRRRLDVAIGIVGRPRLLFLDEPTTGFDPQARRRFWEVVTELARSGMTIVLTTHYLDEAEALADRVAVLARGRIVADGSPATLGGRADRRSTVTWTEDGTTRSVACDDPSKAVAELSARFGGTVPGLSISRPSLEEVYLGLVGDGAPSGAA